MTHCRENISPALVSSLLGNAHCCQASLSRGAFFKCKILNVGAASLHCRPQTVRNGNILSPNDANCM